MGVLDRGFAAVYDLVLHGAERSGLADTRRELLAGLTGHVVEIGAGTGANIPHLGSDVRTALLCEPVPEMAARLRRKLAHGELELPAGIDLTVVEAPGEALPVADDAADAVVSTLVLCSVDDVTRTLAEIRRVLRPGGTLVLLEHVVGHGRAARVQRLVEPAWRVVARGCHLTRDTLTHVRAAGFDTAEVAPWGLPGGGPTGTAIAGWARQP